MNDINDDLEELEDFVYDLEDDDYDDYDLEDDDDEDYDFEDDDMGFFEIHCPNCKEDIMVDFEALDDDAPIICPNCNQEIELEFDCDCDDCKEEEKVIKEAVALNATASFGAE